MMQQQEEELCNFLCAAVCNIKEMRGPNGENITRNESLFAKALSWKIARKCTYASTMARVQVKRWLGGGGSGKGVIKPGRSTIQCLKRISRYSRITVLIHPVILQQREQDNYKMSRTAHWRQVECLSLNPSPLLPLQAVQS